MRIFGYKPMSTWDRFENLMKIMQDSEQFLNKNKTEITQTIAKQSTKKGLVQKTDEKAGKIFDAQA